MDPPLPKREVAEICSTTWRPAFEFALQSFTFICKKNPNTEFGTLEIKKFLGYPVNKVFLNFVERKG